MPIAQSKDSIEVCRHCAMSRLPPGEDWGSHADDCWRPLLGAKVQQFYNLVHSDACPDVHV